MADFEAILGVYKRQFLTALFVLAIIVPFAFAGEDDAPPQTTQQVRSDLVAADMAARKKQAERSARSIDDGN